MRIIISPAKQMRVDNDTFSCAELPVFLERAEVLKDSCRGLGLFQRFFLREGAFFPLPLGLLNMKARAKSIASL